MSELATVYIISKGRPQCHTARTLERMKYPGDWFIVCGDNDETLPEYMARWGSDRVLVFDWADYCAHVDVMDNFGFEEMPSGAAPARNAARDFSRARGERRHWQLDDDYTGFQITDVKRMKRPTIRDGAAFQRELERLAAFADSCGMKNVGFVPSTIESAPQQWCSVAFRVFNAHNMPSGDDFELWRGRMSDDLINALDVWRHGGYEMAVRYLSMGMPNTQSEAGGLTDIYKDEGTVRKTCYAIMACPGQVKLVRRFGRWHHAADWKHIVPKLVREHHKREG